MISTPKSTNYQCVSHKILLGRFSPIDDGTYTPTRFRIRLRFAAFIHDVDHQGVPNTRLRPRERSIELNCTEIHPWPKSIRLIESDFDEFRSIIFESQDDQFQMHRIVTNVYLVQI
ncbi:hypothetical protein ACHAW5_005305 [Stephanodiscus triporus]|uniref:Uncharacterized protein n=1 Tax=Stephanodiscus triporus TaxID=2934178 RepID=A0ABD3PBQ8_9STRA